MNDDINIYENIRQIAYELIANNTNISRSELAYKLKELGFVNGDGMDVARLVWGAYGYFNGDRAIYDAFISNNEKTNVVDEYRTIGSFENGHGDNAFVFARETLMDTSKMLKELDGLSSGWISRQSTTVGSSFISFIQGTSGIEKVRAQGGQLYANYSHLVDQYNDSRDFLKLNIRDFVSIRSEIADIFRHYSFSLVDIFGDRIRVIEPDLFDFNSIKYLDTASMLESLQLKFNELQQNCAYLLNEISDSFQNSLSGAMSDIKLFGQADRRIGFAMAGLRMLGHYFQANNYSTIIKQEFEYLKNAVNYDEARIRADMGRLLVIFKNINSVFIPKAEAFFRHSRALLSEDLQTIKDILYASKEAQELYEQRECLLSQIKACDIDISDHKQNIAYYKEQISDYRRIIKSLEPTYNQAMMNRPKKPSFIKNLFSFGVSNSNYHRSLSEWFDAYGQSVHCFEGISVDLKISEEDYKSNTEQLNKKFQQHKQLSHQLKTTNTSLLQIVNSSPELKNKMLSKLVPMVGLLRLGKEILQMRISDNLSRVVDIGDKYDLSLPVEVEKQISHFANSLREQITVDNIGVSRIVDDLNRKQLSQDNSRKSSLEEGGENEAIIQKSTQLIDMTNTVIDNGVSFVENFVRLQAIKANGRINAKKYQQEYDSIMSGFRQEIDNIQDKSTYLRQLLTKINLAEDSDSRRAAMLMLSDVTGTSFSETEMNDFLEGKINITI